MGAHAMTLADKIGVLEHGRLVQIGTPKEVYRKPNSVYVAQRLGSPPMNLLPMGVLNQHSPSSAKRVGVRPENIRLGNDDKAARVVQLEPLGSETVVILEVEGQRVKALSDSGTRWRIGQETKVSVLPQNSLFFDSSGQHLAAA